MKTYITRRQVREINKKLFANDLIYNGDDTNTLEEIIANIIQRYDPADSLSGVPTILGLKENNIGNDIIDKITLMDKESVLIQINNSIFSKHDKVEIIKQIKERNYKIIVEINKDDTIFTLAKIFADYIKFDIQNLPHSIFETNNTFSCKKIVYNVNSADDFVLAESANIDYYEGTYISPYTQIEIKNDGHSKVNFMQLMTSINNDSDIKELANIISRDALLSAQIIKLSNSAYYGAMKHVTSISDAVLRIGLDTLKKLIFILQFNRNDNISEEILQISYHRAVFCEKIIKESKNNKLIINKDDAYIIGLFSALDILTGKIMDNVVSNMGLNNVIINALLYRDGIGGKLLNLVKAYEEANWLKVEQYICEFKINKDKMFKAYFDSLDEVTRLWKELAEIGGIIL